MRYVSLATKTQIPCGISLQIMFCVQIQLVSCFPDYVYGFDFYSLPASLRKGVKLYEVTLELAALSLS
jgi:hypothetical protein